MCGITGAIAFEPESSPITEALITRMRDALAHRGPDGAGTWVAADATVGLGHRRLAIIDPSTAAAQPMVSADGQLRLVFNGEIYNHAELRRELERAGRTRWATDHSDTEVLLQAYEHWGIDCLERLRGMFAFAVWDARARSLTLARDRIGVKPLYFSRRNARFAFASEIKALLADPEQEAAVDEAAFVDYLSFLTTAAPHTLFRGIHKLPAGCTLHVTHTGELTQRRYWDILTRAESLAGVPRSELVARLREELRMSVALRKVADVPVGVFLSGGVDSSTNTALFSEGESRPVRTFSIGYDREYASYPSELGHAREVARALGTEHHELVLGAAEVADFLPRMAELQDEPLGDPVCVPVFYVSQLARANGVKVCQVGEGADELFCGYPSWRQALRLERWNRWAVPTALKRAGLAGLRMVGKDESAYYEWLRRGAAREPIFWGGAEGFRPTGLQRLLSGRLREAFRGRSGWQTIEPMWRHFLAHSRDPAPLQWMSYVDLQLRLPELLLMRVDKMSMGASLEARVPFLDHRLVEFAFGVPAAEKTRDGRLKGLLKDAVSGLVPQAVIERPKQGFGVPVHEWLTHELREFTREAVAAFVRGTDLLDARQVESLFVRNRTHDLWVLLNVALWWNRYVK
ncbi:MAG: asparagine synthase (glutamine-hydrolyzing) [Planctomycetota bacterium]